MTKQNRADMSQQCQSIKVREESLTAFTISVSFNGACRLACNLAFYFSRPIKTRWGAILLPKDHGVGVFHEDHGNN